MILIREQPMVIPYVDNPFRHLPLLTSMQAMDARMGYFVLCGRNVGGHSIINDTRPRSWRYLDVDDHLAYRSDVCPATSVSIHRGLHRI